MNIDQAIRTFADFLNSSWMTAVPLLTERSYTSDESSVNDWLQANWELLVERKVLNADQYLEVYGDGADFNSASSRMTDPQALPNFKVIVKSRNGSPMLDLLNSEHFSGEQLAFEKVVGFKNGFYVLEPEFKHVLATDERSGQERVVALEDVVFELKSL